MASPGTGLVAGIRPGRCVLQEVVVERGLAELVSAAGWGSPGWMPALSATAPDPPGGGESLNFSPARPLCHTEVLLVPTSLQVSGQQRESMYCVGGHQGHRPPAGGYWAALVVTFCFMRHLHPREWCGLVK